MAAFSAAAEIQPDGLTLFQHQALAAISEFVDLHNLKRVAMEKEKASYLVGPIGSQGQELYIYPNEAGIFGAKPYVWFEEWDYRSPNELLVALTKECAARAD